ncbi:hypothetical protein LOD99_13187 [Oopsacas minuta]|uniref:Uncharacterized protein n=1 Tax=Oopsacas minuta TaxID=111878 RepID=A0AAV7JB19_9METZ|nr:hypothetical protein LOD99_13187 [Oopsacas minuta]
MNYEYTKKVLLILALIFMISAPLAKGQDEEEDTSGFIAELRDEDFDLVITRYKTRIILITLSSLLICYVCCAAVCFLPSISVMVCGCRVMADEVGSKTKCTREPDNNAVVVIERRGDVEMCRTEQVQLPVIEHGPQPRINPYHNTAMVNSGNVQPYLTFTQEKVNVNRKMSDGRQSIDYSRDGISVDEIGIENTKRYNFLSMDDLNKIEKRAKEYSLKRVEMGESKV